MCLTLRHCCGKPPQIRHLCVSQVKHFEKKREQEALKSQYIKKLEAEGVKPL